MVLLDILSTREVGALDAIVFARFEDDVRGEIVLCNLC